MQSSGAARRLLYAEANLDVDLDVASLDTALVGRERLLLGALADDGEVGKLQCSKGSITGCKGRGSGFAQMMPMMMIAKPTRS